LDNGNNALDILHHEAVLNAVAAAVRRPQLFPLMRWAVAGWMGLLVQAGHMVRSDDGQLLMVRNGEALEQLLFALTLQDLFEDIFRVIAYLDDVYLLSWFMKH
jgi:hypothetical protein